MEERTIYMLFCEKTRKAYIGQTAGTAKGRVDEHFQKLRAGIHGSRLLQHDFDKYGEKSFIYFDLEKCHIRANNVPNNQEKKWMEKFNTYNPHFGYNYADPFYGNGIKDHVKRCEYVAEKFKFPVDLLI